MTAQEREAPATAGQVADLRAEVSLLRAELAAVAARLDRAAAAGPGAAPAGGHRRKGSPAAPPDVMRASGRCTCGNYLKGHELALEMCHKCWTRRNT